MYSPDEEKALENLLSWTVVSVSSKLIEIDLEFDQPLNVSQGDSRDQLLIQLNLKHFPDENDLRLPASLVKTKEIPPQIGSK